MLILLSLVHSCYTDIIVSFIGVNEYMFMHIVDKYISVLFWEQTNKHEGKYKYETDYQENCPCKNGCFTSLFTKCT
jgi:hypothetical protein